VSPTSTLLRAPALSAQGCVGLVSPAGPSAGAFPRRFIRGIEELRRRGFRTRLGRHVTAKLGHTAGSVEERVDDLHRMFDDPEVELVLSTIGGFNSHQLLEHLDFDLIRARPKLFVGYSDITALLVALHVRAGIVTVLGPALMPQFGEPGGVHSYTWTYFARVLMEGWHGAFEPSSGWYEEQQFWDAEDERERTPVRNPGPRTLRSGTAEGPIIAGNASTLLVLAGTPYWPDTSGGLLLIEEAEDATPATIDRHLFHLRHAGVFDRITGLVLGRFRPEVGFSSECPLDAIVLRATRGYEFPIAADFDFGHTDPMFPLPLGVPARLTATRSPRLELLSPAVRRA
jgi:muramoyltetrapeptide carboxypeptidase